MAIPGALHELWSLIACLKDVPPPPEEAKEVPRRCSPAHCNLLLRRGAILQRCRVCPPLFNFSYSGPNPATFL